MVVFHHREGIVSEDLRLRRVLYECTSDRSVASIHGISLRDGPPRPTKPDAARRKRPL